jgi:hypothetical protein
LLAIIRRLSRLSYGGVFFCSSEVFLFWPPLRFAERSPEGMEKDIPPMLAAQSNFPSGSLPSFHKYSINEFGDDPKI